MNAAMPSKSVRPSRGVRDAIPNSTAIDVRTVAARGRRRECDATLQILRQPASSVACDLIAPPPPMKVLSRAERSQRNVYSHKWRNNQGFWSVCPEPQGYFLTGCQPGWRNSALTRHHARYRQNANAALPIQAAPSARTAPTTTQCERSLGTSASRVTRLRHDKVALSDHSCQQDSRIFLQRPMALSFGAQRTIRRGGRIP